jgi:hypothetical protein
VWDSAVFGGDQENFETLYEVIISEQDNLLKLCYDYVKAHERTRTTRRRDPQTKKFVGQEGDDLCALRWSGRPPRRPSGVIL